MYCKKCGTKQQDGQKFCPKCGTPYEETKQTKIEVVCDVAKEKVEKVLLEEKPPINPGEVLPGSDGAETKHVHEDVEPSLPKQNEVQQVKNDTKYDFNPEDVKYVGRMFVVGLGIAIIALPFLMHGFSFGLFWYLTIVAVGYLLYKIFEKGVKNLSISDIKKGIIAFSIIGLIMFMWGPLSTSYVSSGGDNYDNSSLNSNTSSGYTSDNFDSEQDVRQYLMSHRFSSGDGYTLSFSRNGYEAYLNGTLLSQNVQIITYSSSSATLRTHGPYGNTTLYLSSGVIKDQDGTYYYAK